MKERQTRILVNPVARKAEREKAVGLLLAIPNAQIVDLTFPLDPIPDAVDTAVVIGGDGSLRAVTEKLLERDHPGRLIVVPGGTHNGMHRVLRESGAVITPQQLKEDEPIDIPPFKPGMIHDRFFNHSAGWGPLEVEIGHRSKQPSVLHMPRKLRYVGVGFHTATKLLVQGKLPSVMEFVTTTPYVGPVKILQEQSLHSDQLAQVTIHGSTIPETAAHMSLLLFYGLFRKRPPERVLSVQYGKEFVLQQEQTIFEVNMDGEVKQILNKGNIYIRRSSKPLQAAALV